ncbi:MAG TPA: substrate-binding domain-containing protein [Terriglobales bacterium]|jgi:ribose transport system substrate-binding protein|nr:substrate-binding domain-containing protein [Terriglobales bacterium]
MYYSAQDSFLVSSAVEWIMPPYCPSVMRQVACFAAVLVCVFSTACRPRSKLVAVIPRSCGTVLWEPEHAGAAHLARKNGIEVYWNAPPREDDVEGQIALLSKVADRSPAGVILTPDETLPFRTPVRRIVDRGLPVVVVGTQLGIAPSKKLAYVLNDDETGGQIAARRLGAVLAGKGSVAILGINPQLTGLTARERSLERTLAEEFPGIHVVARRLGHASVPQEQQIAEDLLIGGTRLDAIVALSASSTRGAYYAIVEFGKPRVIKIIGFDQDLIPPLRTGGIDSIVMQRTYDMGHVAMNLMLSQLKGESVPGTTVLPPLLLTRENLDSAEIYDQLTASWWASE